MIHNVIRGRSAPAAAGGHRELIDPATGRAHAVVTESRAADVLEAHADELSDLEVADTGKAPDATRDEEIPASIDVVRFYAGACRMRKAAAPASTSRASRRASATSRSGYADRSRHGTTRS